MERTQEQTTQVNTLQQAAELKEQELEQVAAGKAYPAYPGQRRISLDIIGYGNRRR